MIKKLEIEEIEKDCGAFGKIIIEKKLATEQEMQEKINELVDAVNALVYENDKDSDWYDRQTRSENVQDKFAEQRKWIGKLCKFWDIDNDNLYYGPLTKIHDTSPYCYECNHKICYANCEPVKDDIIYKGGDND